MADWSQPALTSPYAQFLTDIEARNIDCITQMQSDTGTNLPDQSMRWNPSTYRWETYSLSAGTWSAWTTQLSIGAINLGGNPTSALQAATKQYVDAVSAALSNYQPAGSYAATGGSSSQAFLVANSTAATQQAVPRAQADTLYAPIGSYASQSGTAGNSFFVNSGSNTTEGDIGANCGGVNSAYLFNNSTTWGVTSSDGGYLGNYTRPTSVFSYANGGFTIINGNGLQCRSFQAANGSTFNGQTGYSFISDDEYDSGMFSSGDGYVDFYTNATKAFTLYGGNGTFWSNCTVTNTLSAGTVTQTSDGRLKTDIQPIDRPLDRVERLHGVFFRWKSDPRGDRATGLIAQDVAVAIPEAVGHNDHHLTVAYGSLVGLLVEAIKELRAEVAELRASR